MLVLNAIAAVPLAGRSWGARAGASGVDAIRMLDITLSVIALLFCAPLLLLIATLLWIEGDGAMVFAHRRLGRGGGAFDCFKFRSMYSDAEARLVDLLAESESARAEWARDHKLRDDPRITRIGAFLRKSSLDELPQLLNVLRGDMSIVGPRPIVEAERARYGRRFAQYASVRPGITGLWQVSGRNNVTYRRRVALDVAYARRRSLRLNCRIIVATVPAVLLSRGVF